MNLKAFPVFFSALGLSLTAATSRGQSTVPATTSSNPPPSALTVPAIPIVLPQDAKPGEQKLAQELADDLAQVYPSQKFEVGTQSPPEGKYILLGLSANPLIASQLGKAAPFAPESFVVTSKENGPSECGIIAGADERGLAYGVYALLGKLGWGFYLSYNAKPPPRTGAFSWDDWQVSDKPLVADRVVFEWHNFLSGCSAWNLPDWESWISQSRKMGYNTIMVHAYGNNPMLNFELNGKIKPLGYLSTTVRGRDWATEHVNDVRRLSGGEVFNEPVFGADAAQGPEEQRGPAAQKLMQDCFAYATKQSMNIILSTDVDTVPANPQELIKTLPLDARFPEGNFWLANPDTPEGYCYYKAQAQALMTAYPGVTCVALWFRRDSTPWLNLKVEDMPPVWRTEYQSAIAAAPEAAGEWHSPAIFALSKVAAAWRRALDELGRKQVRLAVGNWNFDFLPAADRFLPAGVTLIGLDYNIISDKSDLSTPEQRQRLAAVGSHRPLIPIIWPQHDDGKYLGRGFTPFTDFQKKLAEAQASGFGVIHWMTRPLDLFLLAHIRQVWGQTENEPLATTTQKFAVKSFGASAGQAMSSYLQKWETDAPLFARETGPFLVDRPLANIPSVIAGCRSRISDLDAIDLASLTREQQDRVRYWRGLEEFTASFFQAQGQFQDTEALCAQGQLDAARALLAQSQPEAVIKQYAAAASLSGITRGEQGVIVSLNTRWFSYFIGLRQKLRVEPVRVNFGPTSRDPLAQQPGKLSFTIDSKGNWWLTLGAQETGAETFTQPNADNEMGRTGIQSVRPIELKLGATLLGPTLAKKSGESLPAGHYRVRLLLLDPDSTAPGERVFTIAIGKTSENVDIFKDAGSAGKIVEKIYPVTLDQPGQVEVTLTPITGKAAISGILVEPME